MQTIDIFCYFCYTENSTNPINNVQRRNIMKPAYKTYILASYWSWDNFHEELATITFEDFNLDGKPVHSIEEILREPDDSQRKTYSRILRRIANAQNGNVMDHIRLVRLYLVVDIESSCSVSSREMKFKLQPICNFDEDDNMIPINTGAPNS